VGRLVSRQSFGRILSADAPTGRFVYRRPFGRVSTCMSKEINAIIRHLQQYSPSKMAGAVKTFPMRDLLKNSQILQEALQNPPEEDGGETLTLETAYNKLQQVIAKRMEAAQALVAKFSDASPEVIALNNSVFSLVPSRDLLEDVKTAYLNSGHLVKALTLASQNILEAVNIEIQQRFYDSSPEMIAVNHSGSELDAYRKLLKSLLTNMDVDTDLFKVYSKIIRNVIDGSRIYDADIAQAKALCEHVFSATPPDFDGVFNQYNIADLEAHQALLQATLAILRKDITGRPSIVEFSTHCQQMLHALTKHFAYRKIQMRKTTRVLQLSHYMSFLSIEQVAENSAISLMLCQALFEETRRFLQTQHTHLDVTLNIKSLEEANQKVLEGLRYRQYAMIQLFQEISSLSREELMVFPEKRLGDNTLLLQEIQHLVNEYLRRVPENPDPTIIRLSQALQENIAKLHDAITQSKKTTPISQKTPTWELGEHLPNLSKFYDKEMFELIRKALKIGNTPPVSEERLDLPGGLERVFTISFTQLQEYITSFLRVSQRA